MKNSKGCVQWTIAAAGLLLMMLVAGCVWLWFGLVEPYRTFRIREQEIVPQLDALNDAVAKTLPSLPPTALEDDRWSVGITNPIYDHGRWLIISMSVSPTTTSEEISGHYRENLLQAGWSEDNTYAYDFDLFYRDTACIELLYLTERLHSYQITIWHDFRGQSFRPALPNWEYMGLVEYGETNFATCPLD